MDADIVALQETRVASESIRAVSVEMSNRKRELLCGAMRPVKVAPGGVRHTAYGGVAVMVRHGIPLQEVPPSHRACIAAHKAGRYIRAQIAYGEGSTCLTLFSVYGNVDDKENTSRIMEGVFEEAAALGDVPVIIAGDLNVTPGGCGYIEAAIATGRWIDAAATAADWHGATPEDTCTAGGGSRIDYILLNSVAAAALQEVEVVHDAVVFTHRPIIVTLDLERFHQRNPTANRPRCFETGTWDDWPERKVMDLAREMVQRHYRRSDDIDAQWDSVCTAAEQFLARRGEAEPQQQQLGRGKVKRDKMRFTRAQQGDGSAEAEDRERMSLMKACRKLEQLSRSAAKKDHPSQDSVETQRLWDSARKDGRRLLPGKSDPVWNQKRCPTGEELLALRTKLRRRHDDLGKAIQKQRVRDWKERMRMYMVEKPRRVFDWCKAKLVEKTTMLKRADGTLTADLREMDSLLRDTSAWGGIFRRYADRPEPAWDVFRDRYGRYFPEPQEITVEPLTAKCLRDAIAKMGSNKAAGLDGWRVAELKALPAPILECMAATLNDVERTGEWPRAIARAAVALIPKGKGPDPLQQRPITITSVMYRAWASARLKSVSPWQDKWAHAHQHGFRGGRGTDDLLWHLGLRIEEAAMCGDTLVGATFDYKKCFDQVPQEIMLRLMSHLGLPECILRAIHGMYDGLLRRFKLPAGLGQEWKATNGILQGCPLSIIFLNALVCVWMRTVEAESGVSTAAYADDTHVLASSAPQLQNAVNITEEYSRVTGQEIHPGKSAWWCSSGTCGDAAITLGDVEIPKTEDLDCLGGRFHTKERDKPAASSTKASERFEIALRAAARVARLPLRQELKERIMVALVLAMALYGICVQFVDSGPLTRLANGIEDGIIGRNRHRMRCVPVSLGLLRKSHKVDPFVAADCKRVMTWVRMVRKYPRLRRTLDKLLTETSLRREHRRAGGPAGVLMATFKRLKWQLVSSHVVSVQGRRWDVLRVDLGVFGHMVRDAAVDARMRGVNTMENHRVSLNGINDGVDRDSTLQLLKDTKCGMNAYELGTLRHIMADAAMPGKRLKKRGISDTDICQFCEDDVVEDHRHMWYQCTAWDDIRAQFPRARETPGWSTCLRHCGVKTRADSASKTTMRELHRMMVAITLQRERASRASREEVADLERYPWDWSPAETEPCEIKLDRIRPLGAGAANWKWTHHLYLGLVWWLQQLRWANEPRMEVTSIELLIDFEVATGLNVAADIRADTRKSAAVAGRIKAAVESMEPREAQGATANGQEDEDDDDSEDRQEQDGESSEDDAPKGSHPELAKSFTFWWMLQALNNLNGGVPVIPGRTKSSWMLTPLGGKYRTGVDRRPVCGW